MKEVTFQKALEIIESFPEEQRESLIEVVKHRLLEERRDRLPLSIKAGREELSRGEFKRGTVDDRLYRPEEC